MKYGYLYYTIFGSDNQEREKRLNDYLKENDLSEVAIIRDKDNERNNLFSMVDSIGVTYTDLIIYTDNFFSLSSSIVNVYEVVKYIVEKGATLVFTDFNYMVNNENKDMFLMTLKQLTNMKTQLTSITSKEGVRKAIASGKKVGRRRGYTYSKLDRYEKDICRKLDMGYSKSKIAKYYDVEYATVLRFLKSKNLKTLKERV